MRNALAIVAMIHAGLALGACGKSGEDEGVEAAKREAEAEAKKAAAERPVDQTKKINPPVRADVKIPCDELVDLAAFTAALGEKEPLTLKDISNSDKESTSSCSLVRGGKRLTPAEQEQLLKKERRLGTMAGDDVCNITAYCATVEDEQHFRERCKADGKDFHDDESMGFYTCVRVVATGADDVNTYRFLDNDTKCVFQVRGGPSMVDNDVIQKCTKAAHDLIGPANIKIGGPSANPPAGSGAASGSGAAAGSGSSAGK